MKKKFIAIFLLALIASAADSLLFNLKNVQAKPPYLASCTYDANGNVLQYTCNYIHSPDGCAQSNC